MDGSQPPLGQAADQVYWATSPPAKNPPHLGDDRFLDDEISEMVSLFSEADHAEGSPPKNAAERLFSEERLKRFDSAQLGVLCPPSPERRARAQRAHSYDPKRVHRTPTVNSDAEAESRRLLDRFLAAQRTPDPKAVAVKEAGQKRTVDQRSPASPQLAHKRSAVDALPFGSPPEQGGNPFRRSASTPHPTPAAPRMRLPPTNLPARTADKTLPALPSLLRSTSSFDIEDIAELEAAMSVYESQIPKNCKLPPPATRTPELPVPPLLVDQDARAEKKYQSHPAPRVEPPLVVTGLNLKPATPNAAAALPISTAHLPPSREPGHRQYERFLVLQVTVQYYPAAPVAAGQGPATTYQYPERVLRLFAERAGYERFAHLREDWWGTEVAVGDYVHVVATFDLASRRTVIDNTTGMLVVHPDCLITSTNLSNAFVCLRRSVLQGRVREPSDLNAAMIYGSLIHQLFQSAIRVNDFSPAYLDPLIGRLVNHAIPDLFLVGEDEAKATAHLQEWSVVLRNWAQTYVRPAPHPEAVVKGHCPVPDDPAAPPVGPSTAVVAIQRVLDIEENIWSPMYGLKGKIDVSVQAVVREPRANGGTRTRTLVLPLELKTSKSSRVTAHRAQVALYTLLMADRYDLPVTAGLLYYMKTHETVLIPGLRDELRGLIIKRNEMANYLVGSQRRRQQLPPMIKDPRTCKTCPALTTCLLFHRAVELGTEASSGLGALFTARMQTVTSSQEAFFARWQQLIDLEETDIARLRRELWTLQAPEREALGRCLAGLIVLEYPPEDTSEVDGIDRFRYRFHRPAQPATTATSPPEGAGSPSTAAAATSSTVSFLHSQINAGDPIVVSSEVGHYALALGFVLEISERELVITLDRALRGIPRRVTPFNRVTNQQHTGVMEVAFMPATRPGYPPQIRTRVTHYGVRRTATSADLNDGDTTTVAAVRHAKSVTVGQGTPPNVSTTLSTYRVDRDELTTGMSAIRYNLVALFSPDGDLRRRRLLVDLEAPRFRRQILTTEGRSLNTQGTGPHPTPTPTPTPTPAAVAPPAVNVADSNDEDDERDRLHVPADRLAALARLNVDQREAVAKVLNAQDYTLILGMPGTGKTSTIAFLVNVLVACGQSVLLTSYTHTAVDNILLKVAEDNPDLRAIRLGSRMRVHPGVQHFVAQTAHLTTVHQVEAYYADAQVVATTCLGIGHALFQKRRFDFCIVDEASQITLPVCVGPLRFARRFVLVGDHYQLPPLVRTTEARLHGLSLSLFKQLSEAHPESVVTLAHQYRMNADIMRLVNHLIYDQRLRCGTGRVAHATLALPNLQRGLEMLHTAPTACSQGGPLGWLPCPGPTDCWLAAAVDPQRSVVLLDTDRLPAPEVRMGDLIQNPAEADLAYQLVECLIRCGLPEDEIGLITPYRAQVKLLRHRLAEARPAVEVHTVDKYQGRDKRCILMSFVRSNSGGHVGELLRDWRRINVALTRAKHKLVLIGSATTLNETPLFAEMLRFLNGRDWVLTLPPGAHQRHEIPTTLSTSQAMKPIGPELPRKAQRGGAIDSTVRSEIATDHPLLENLLDDLEADLLCP
ncbi:DNA replication endonuclease-helicase Dna2 [Tieghemiomyces parasiticus]|uniref:DNA replication ATP-dependent helicase/nuclease n=1 Tax=Tieghemiomyces parasiticus TaxID=78921 RepID=A0A9W8ADP3_9FUNG|nr:DNA replication endonuclease-helicase Dna2 [Tieghemiomyces parasiticus]